MNTHYLNPALKAILCSFLLMILATSAVAQDEKKPEKAMEAPGTVATIWVIWPKAGQSSQFEAAIKKYGAWRKSAGEEFIWQIYQPVVGSDLAHYVIRSGQHTWRDMDTNAAWEMEAKASEAYEEQLGAMTDRAEHYFAETDTEHSHWIENPDYKYYGVSRYVTKPGTYGERMEAMNKIQKAVEDEKWAYPYEISYPIGGRSGMNIVTPMKGYADMADPDPSLMKIVAKSLGSESAAANTMKQFGNTIEGEDYTVYVHRPDLSTPK